MALTPLVIAEPLTRCGPVVRAVLEQPTLEIPTMASGPREWHQQASGGGAARDRLGAARTAGRDVTDRTATHPLASVPYLNLARQAAALLFGPVEERSFAVRYWTGLIEPTGRTPAGYAPAAPDSEQHGAPPFTLVLHSPAALRCMFLPPTEVTLAEAFVSGAVDVEGNLESAAGLPAEVAARLRSPGRLVRITALLLRLPRRVHVVQGANAPDGARARASEGVREAVESAAVRESVRRAGRRHSRDRDAAAIRSHYDVGNDFYSLWLDAEQVYSCGYFPTGTEDIDAAQRAKLDLICRKLRLLPGERLLDVGCGWGGLLRHAVRHYGVEALGITLSPSQASYTRARLEAEGLAERCRVEVLDYRDLPHGLTFDKVVSVGMFEHVGRAQLATYFRTALRLTRPGGLFLNHGIIGLADARMDAPGGRVMRLWRTGKFMDRYVFPDGELVPCAAALAAAEGAGFETRDVESLREHYTVTLRHWVRRLEARHGDAARLAGERVYRIWRLYMAACAHAFVTGRIGVLQMLFARPDADGRCQLPRTRDDLYARGPRSSTA